MARESIFQLADNGQLASLRKHDTGKVRWKKKLGRLAASAPALGGGRVYVTLLEGGRGAGRGRVVALRQRNGKQRWSRDAAEPQRVLAAAARRARLLRHRERDALLPRRRQRQGDLDLPRGGRDQGQPDARRTAKLFFGDYGGHVQAVRASQRPPRLVGGGGAAADSTRPRPSPAAGSSSAARRARVRVLDPERPRALGRTGPGATSTPRRRSARERVRTDVFFGSYDGRFYALGARTGSVRWSYNAGRPDLRLGRR